MKTIQETLDFILKSITPEPQAGDITVGTREENGLVILEISAPSDTIGQIIGKDGRIIKAIRTILGAGYPNLRFNVTLKD